ncbi:hypothetical protein [Antrihabitans cavernicola]|uniref:hypothetical protein n=1 Tax=Antrihabitans cavernicola TaxID=2495913 RepID=UPI001F20FC42|nr:hypothetical protein [Spelaeibacter cavernicola]
MNDKRTDGSVSGHFVTAEFDYDGGREVTVFVPPEPPKAIVFAGDGERSRNGACCSRQRAHLRR